MNELFDLDAFIAGINQDKSQKKSGKDYLNKVLMNTRDNQGLCTFIPIISKSNKGIYTKIPRVYEFYGDTSLIQAGEGWYRILPLEFYDGLSADDLALYNEVKGMLDELNDNEEVDRDEFRVRNYALFHGICLSMKNSEGKQIDDYKDCPCLFVYPSNSPIDQLSVAINAKCDSLKSKEWIQYVITPALKGRKGIMQISFTKSAGVGYDASVSFEMNSEFSKIIDPEMEIKQETINLFDNVLPTFLGWIYDSKSKSLFNRTAFIELRNQLVDRISQMNGVSTPQGPQPADASIQYKNNNGVSTPSEQPTGAKKTVPF